jgi:hypothetical protein
MIAVRMMQVPAH